MTPNQSKALLKAAVCRRCPILMVGQPGVGKTDIGHQIVDELSSESGVDYDLLVLHPVISDPTDFKGLPAVIDSDDGKQAVFLPYSDLKALAEADRPTVCIIDDLGQASNMVQGALMQLLLARRIGEHKVSPDVAFIAASNRRQDRAGVSGVLEPVKSRFLSIVEVTPDSNDWQVWARRAGVNDYVRAYVHWRPDVVRAWKPTSDMTNMPTPRTLANAGEIVDMDLPDEILPEALAGAVGAEAAGELTAFMKIAADLPNLEELLDRPEIGLNTLDSSRPELLWSLSVGLATYVTDDRVPAFLRIVNELPKEFGIVATRELQAKRPALWERNNMAVSLAGHLHDALMG